MSSSVSVFVSFSPIISHTVRLPEVLAHDGDGLPPVGAARTRALRLMRYPLAASFALFDGYGHAFCSFFYCAGM